MGMEIVMETTRALPAATITQGKDPATALFSPEIELLGGR